MSKRDKTQQQHEPELKAAGGRGTDDRRSPVNPNDKPVPRSPEPEPDAVRAGVEKLERVKPY